MDGWCTVTSSQAQAGGPWASDEVTVTNRYGLRTAQPSGRMPVFHSVAALVSWWFSTAGSVGMPPFPFPDGWKPPFTAAKMATATVAAGFQPAGEPGFQPGGFRPADHAEDAKIGDGALGERALPHLGYGDGALGERALPEAWQSIAGRAGCPSPSRAADCPSATRQVANLRYDGGSRSFRSADWQSAVAPAASRRGLAETHAKTQRGAVGTDADSPLQSKGSVCCPGRSIPAPALGVRRRAGAFPKRQQAAALQTLCVLQAVGSPCKR